MGREPVDIATGRRVDGAFLKSTTLSWPVPVSRRLDQLVERANESGANCTRSDLAAALVAFAADDSAALLDVVLRYRRLRIRDVLLDLPDDQEVVHLPLPGPGRRPAADR